MARQFVVQLDYRPGDLAHLARALAARGIEIRHIGGLGAGDLGCALSRRPTTLQAVALRRAIAEILAVLLPARRLRANARVVKRKISNFGVKRAAHRA